MSAFSVRSPPELHTKALHDLGYRPSPTLRDLLIADSEDLEQRHRRLVARHIVDGLGRTVSYIDEGRTLSGDLPNTITGSSKL